MSGQQLELKSMKRQWIDDVAGQFAAHAEKGFEFSADWIHANFTEPWEPNWYGGLLAKLKNEGLIQEIGRVVSSRPERNWAKISLWKVV